MISAAVVTYTFGQDGACAVPCARAVARLGLPHFVLDDAAAPLSREHRAAVAAAGGRVFRTTFQRQGNLNGLENLAGQFATFKAAGAAAGGVDWVIKLDSDTILQAIDWLENLSSITYAAVCFSQPKWWFQGPVYALSLAWLDRISAPLSGPIAPACLAPLAPHYPEDVATGWLAAEAAGPAGVVTHQGYPTGHGIAHWQYAGEERFPLYRPFQAVSFGNRNLLPPQMPPALKRHTAGETMARYLANAPFSGL